MVYIKKIVVLLGILALLLGCGDERRVYKHRFLSISQSKNIPVSILCYSKEAPEWKIVEDFIFDHSRLYDHRVAEGPVGLLNRNGEASLPPETWKAAQLAIEIAKESQGAFDPTILPLLDLWGFSGAAKIPAALEVQKALKRVDYRKLELFSSGMASLPAGFQLDLGGIAKGAIVDSLVENFYSQNYKDFLIEAGGDIVVSGTKARNEKWSVAIRHPRNTDKLLAVLYMGGAGKPQAVVTSGDYERFIIQEGKRYHHLLDPKNGQPARGCVSVTVMAPYCALADALATAAFVMGPEKGLAYLENKADVEGLMIKEQVDGVLEALMTTGFPLDRKQINL